MSSQMKSKIINVTLSYAFLDDCKLLMYYGFDNITSKTLVNIITYFSCKLKYDDSDFCI